MLPTENDKYGVSNMAEAMKWFALRSWCWLSGFIASAAASRAAAAPARESSTGELTVCSMSGIADLGGYTSGTNR